MHMYALGLALQNEGVGNQCGYVRPSLKYHKKQNGPNWSSLGAKLACSRPF